MSMFTVLIKDSEDGASVQYRFGPTTDRLGLLRLDKADRSVEELVRPPGVDSHLDFRNAVLKLYGIIRRGEVFPDETVYAA